MLLHIRHGGLKLSDTGSELEHDYARMILLYLIRKQKPHVDLGKIQMRSIPSGKVVILCHHFYSVYFNVRDRF